MFREMLNGTDPFRLWLAAFVVVAAFRLFLATLTGPGHVALQSMPIMNLAEEIGRFLPGRIHQADAAVRARQFERMMTMLCAQSMERLAAATFTYAGHVNTADTGVVTPSIAWF